MANLLTQDQAIVGDLKVLTGGQVQKVIVGSVARTDTSAKTLGALPAGAIITDVTVYSATASNAGTTATLSLGKSGGTGTEYLNGLDVKGATGSGKQGPVAAVLGAIGSSPVTLTGIYAETGAASTAGGPWLVAVEFVTATS
jgi:hypothetical protein